MIFSKRISLAGWISAVGAILLGDLSGAPCEALGQSEVQKLLPVESVRFGVAAAISGDWAVVGAGGNDAGQPITLAYVFRRDNNGTPLDPSDDVWVEDTVLTAPGPVWNFITASVSVNGDRVLMGVSRDDGPVNDSGAAYVFRRNDNSTPTDPTDDTWVLEAKLTASDAATDDVFGSSVSIDRDRALVGAWGNDDAGDRSGSAYVFRRSDNGTPSDLSDDTWVQEGKLTTSDAAVGDHFGWSVSLSDDRGLVGGLGGGASAYVFRRSDNGTPLDPSDDVWVEEAKLTPSESIPYDGFGFSVSLSGNRALVGAYGLDDGSDFPGAAYVFRHNDNGTPLDLSDDIWVEEARLTASDAAARDEFGVSVSLSGDRAIVGAWQDDDAANLSGSAYMFENIAGSWTQVAKLTASDGAEGDLFGFEVAVSGDTAVIGAHRSGETGAAYVFALGPPDAIPTVSGWGIVVMTLLLLTVGTIVMGRRVGVPS